LRTCIYSPVIALNHVAPIFTPDSSYSKR
jgi:hypothetical protein